jgi:hypothetical protein
MDRQPHEGRTLRETALSAVEATKFFPDWGQARLHAMIANRPDWCVSRQRNWGVPIPFFLHKETGELHPRTPELLEQVAQRVEKQGIDAWFRLDAAELLGAESAQYDKMRDTLDVWFDSGTTHRTVLRGSHPDGSKWPADLYLEGSDQHRGWFHSSLLTACALDGRAPYDGLLTHGFVVDGQGHKMSKSKGNVIAPQKVSDTLGAEVLRLWVAATDYSGELSISDEILKRVVESYRRIRNTLRFLLANTADFDPAKDMLPVAEWLEIDRYALALTRRLQEQVTADYGRYEFHRVVQALQGFCSEELGAFYLDILKDRLYTTVAKSRRRAAQNALFHLTHALTRWMALSCRLPEEGVDTTGRREQLGVPAYLARVAGAGRRRRTARALDPHPRYPCRRPERVGDHTRRRRHRLVIASGGYAARQPGYPRPADAAGRRPALRVDHFAGTPGGRRGRPHRSHPEHGEKMRTLLALPRRCGCACRSSRPVRTLHQQPGRYRRGTQPCLMTSPFRHTGESRCPVC